MSSTCFQGSADSVLALSEPECAPSGSAKLNPSVEPCCTSTGLTSPFIPTSEGSTGPAIAEPLILSAGAIPVSPSVSPDHGAAQMMKGISGLKCLDSYEKSGRDGSLPRMLVGTLTSVSTRLPHRWKLRATPSGRLLFQLQPLMRRTDVTDSGLLPVPTAQMRGRPEIATQQALKGDPLYKRRDEAKAGRQFSIVDYLIYRKLLPTPTASDCKGATDNCRRIKEGKVSYLRYYLHFHLNPSVVTSYPHPSFVESMMGYPIGHTDLGPLEIRSFRKSRKSLVVSSSILKSITHEEPSS